MDKISGSLEIPTSRLVLFSGSRSSRLFFTECPLCVESECSQSSIQSLNDVYGVECQLLVNKKYDFSSRAQKHHRNFLLESVLYRHNLVRVRSLKRSKSSRCNVYSSPRASQPTVYLPPMGHAYYLEAVAYEYVSQSF